MSLLEYVEIPLVKDSSLRKAPIQLSLPSVDPSIKQRLDGSPDRLDTNSFNLPEADHIQ
jgi:hypothetical protein